MQGMWKFCDFQLLIYWLSSMSSGIWRLWHFNEIWRCLTMTCRKPISSSGRAFVDDHKGCGFESHMGFHPWAFVELNFPSFFPCDPVSLRSHPPLLVTKKIRYFLIWYLLDKLPMPLGICQFHSPSPLALQNKEEEEIYLPYKIYIHLKNS